MKLKFNYYFRKKVLADDLNELQANIEESIDRIPRSRQMIGLLVCNHDVVGVGPDFRLQITSGDGFALRATDLNGRRITLPADPFTTDELSSLFTLPGVGNEKYITVVLRSATVTSQPEIERKPPIFTSVDFRTEESFEIAILEGAEVAAPAGDGDKPSLAAEEGVYLCDILLIPGITDFTASTITKDRKRVDPVAEAIICQGADGNTNRFITTTTATETPTTGAWTGDPPVAVVEDTNLAPIGVIPGIVNIPSEAKFLRITTIMTDGTAINFSSGTFIVDMDAAGGSGLIYGAYGSPNTGGAAYNGNPVVPGVVLAVVIGGGPFLRVEINSYSGPGGTLNFRTVGGADFDSSLRVVVEFFR